MVKKINSCQKGKSAEREIAKLLRDYGFEARRGQQFSGGNESPDVISNLDTHIEVKRVESFNLYKAVEQSKTDCKGTNYAIFHRKSNKEWLVIQDANTWLEFQVNYKRLLEIQELYNLEMKNLERSNDERLLE